MGGGGGGMGIGGMGLNLGGPLKTFGASREAAKQHKATEKRYETGREDVMQQTDPKKFGEYFEQFVPIYQKIQEPMRARAADTAAIRGQNMMQAFGTDVGRRGLAGSGAHLFGRQAIRGQTSAEMNKALIDMYIKALTGGEEQAGRTRDLRTEGLLRLNLGIPITHKPSKTGTAASMLGSLF